MQLQSRRCHFRLFSLFITFLAFSGCAKNQQGYYEGYLQIFKKAGSSKVNVKKVGDQNEPRDLKRNKWVAVEVQLKDGGGTVDVLDPVTRKPWMDTSTLSNTFKSTHRFWDRGKFDFYVPSLNTHFKLTKIGNCLEGNSKTENYYAKACMKEFETLEIDIRDESKALILHLLANPFHKPNLPSTVGPLNLKQSIRIGLDTNPGSNAELQRKFRARYNSIRAAARLAPSINASLITTAVDVIASPLSYLSLLGNVAPFLSISHWIDYEKSTLDNEIAVLSYKIFQANLALQIEGLIYNYKRDVVIYAQYVELIERTKKARDTMAIMEKMTLSDGSPYISPGATEAMDILIMWFKNLEISSTLEDDRMAVAQAMGVHDLRLVKNIQIGHEQFPIETTLSNLNLYPKDPDEAAENALEVSLKHLELRQAQLATDVSVLQRTADIFSFVDIAAVLSQSFGFDVLWIGALDTAKVSELREDQMTIYEALRTRTMSTVKAYNSSLQGYQNAEKLLEISKKKLNELIKPIEDFAMALISSDGTLNLLTDHPAIPKKTLDTHNAIKGAFQEYLNMFTLVKSYHSAFRIARATLDRIQLEGYYAHLGDPLPNLAEANTAIIRTEASDCPDDAILDTIAVPGEQSPESGLSVVN